MFIGALSGKDPPLNPLMMLWVNLIMDTMGALALGTESPTLALLDRRPYKRTAPLISRPMFRNIMVQSVFQVRADRESSEEAEAQGWRDCPGRV